MIDIIKNVNRLIMYWLMDLNSEQNLPCFSTYMWEDQIPQVKTHTSSLNLRQSNKKENLELLIFIENIFIFVKRSIVYSTIVCISVFKRDVYFYQ